MRIPLYGVIRPTLLLAILLMALLFLHKDRIPVLRAEQAYRPLVWFMVYAVISIPPVTWSGSVIIEIIPTFVKAVDLFLFTALIISSEKSLKVIFAFCFSQVFMILEPLYLNITQGYRGNSTYLGPRDFADRLSGVPADVINQNGLGFVIVTVIPFLHYMISRGRQVLYKAICLLTLPAILSTVMFTMHRRPSLRFSLPPGCCSGNRCASCY